MMVKKFVVDKKHQKNATSYQDYTLLRMSELRHLHRILFPLKWFWYGFRDFILVLSPWWDLELTDSSDHCTTCRKKLESIDVCVKYYRLCKECFDDLSIEEKLEKVENFLIDLDKPFKGTILMPHLEDFKDEILKDDGYDPKEYKRKKMFESKQKERIKKMERLMNENIKE